MVNSYKKGKYKYVKPLSSKITIMVDKASNTSVKCCHRIYGDCCNGVVEL